MYTQNASSFLNGNMGSLSAGKLNYAAYGFGRASNKALSQETAEPTHSSYLDMFRGGVHGLGVLPEEPSWKDVNCDNAREWMDAVQKGYPSIYSSAFIEWAWQQWWKLKLQGKAVVFQTVGGATTAASEGACICKDMYVLINHRTNPPVDDVYVAYVPCNTPQKIGSTSVSQLMGIKRWSFSGIAELPQNADWWNDGDMALINSHYVFNGIISVSYANWMGAIASKCPSCGTDGKTVTCPPPCVLDDKGNCMKPCAGAVIPCDAPCEGEPPEKGTDCCDNCESTTKNGTTQFYLSKNKTDKSIPVMVRGKTIECTPKNPDKQYQWDCDQVMKQIQSNMKGLGQGQLGPFRGRVVSAGKIASGTANTPCPCDCKEVDGQVQMYVNTNKTGEGDIPFTLPYTTVDCNSKGGLNPDGSPKGGVTNLKINCEDIKNAIAQQGYTMSGLGDCGCGNCQGQNGMGSLSGGKITAYAVGIGIIGFAIYWVFKN